MRDIREAIEGRASQRMEAAPEPENRDPEALRRRAAAHIVELMMERSKLYGMPMPELSRAADEAGIDLGIPRENRGKESPTKDHPGAPEGPPNGSGSA